MVDDVSDPNSDQCKDKAEPHGEEEPPRNRVQPHGPKKVYGLMPISLLVASMSLFHLGYNASVLDPAEGQIRCFIAESFFKRQQPHGNGSQVDLGSTKSWFTVATSLFTAGGMLGSIFGGKISEKYGRKVGLLLSVGMGVLGVAAMALSRTAESFELLLVGRFLTGVSCGLFTCVAPLYISEVAPIRVRGLATSTCSIWFNTAVLLSKLLGGLPESPLGSGSYGSWTYLLAVPLAPLALQLAILPFMPESPRYLLLTRRDVQGAKVALSRLWGPAAVESEVVTILDEASKARIMKRKTSLASTFDGNEVVISCSTVFWQRAKKVLGPLARPKMWLSMTLVVVLIISMQYTGIMILIFYSDSFFRAAGGTACRLRKYGTVCIGAILLASNFMCVLLVERLGRRFLHLMSLYIMLTCLIVVNVCMVLAEQAAAAAKVAANQTQAFVDMYGCSASVTSPAGDAAAESSTADSIAGIVTVVAMLAFVMAFGMGPAATPYIIISELFSQEDRAFGVAVGSFCTWSSQLSIALQFPFVQRGLGEYSLLPYTAILFACCTFLTLYLPETKNRSTEEVSCTLQEPGVWCRPVPFCGGDVFKSRDDIRPAADGGFDEEATLKEKDSLEADDYDGIEVIATMRRNEESHLNIPLTSLRAASDSK